MAPSSGDTDPSANRDGGTGAERTRDQPAVTLDPNDFDYKIWQEGNRTAHVKCFNNTGGPPEKDESTGTYTQYLKLESPFPFQVLHTKSFADGSMAGCQAVVIKPEIPSPFLKLPREIRDEIYAHAMVQEILSLPPHLAADHQHANDGIVLLKQIGSASVDIYRHWKRFKSNRKATGSRKEYLKRKQSLTPGLLTTSRQIYHESLPVLYGANVFEMDAYDELLSIFTQLGNSLRYLRKLHLDGFWEIRDIGKYLEPLVHLQELCIPCPGCWGIRDSTHLANVFFDKAYRWIRGVASVYGDEVRAASLVTILCPRRCQGRWGRKKRNFEKECLLGECFHSELKAAIHIRKSLSFPFMKLPRKVRDKVYSHAMIYNPFSDPDDEVGGTLYIRFDENKNPWRETMDWHRGADRPDGGRQHGLRWSESLTSGILSVNRQIYQEAVQILYGENQFDLTDPEAAEVWLDRIGHAHVYLRDVFVCDPYDNRNIFYKLLHVDRLEIDFAYLYQEDDGKLSLPEKQAGEFFAKIGHWIESAGNLRGGRAAAIDRIRLFDTPNTLEEEEWMSKFFTELKSICG